MSNATVTISATVPAAVKAEAIAVQTVHGMGMARLLREFLVGVAAHDAETLAWLDAARRCTTSATRWASCLDKNNNILR